MAFSARPGDRFVDSLPRRLKSSPIVTGEVTEVDTSEGRRTRKDTLDPSMRGEWGCRSIID